MPNDTDSTDRVAETLRAPVDDSQASTELMTEQTDSEPTSPDIRPKGGWISRLGPGFITAALVFGPGSLTVASSLGASFGFAHLWIIVVATLFMMIFTGMAIRIGLATDRTLLSTIRRTWGAPVAFLIGIGIFLVAASFQAGNAVGAGLAFSELTDTPITPWIIFFTVVSISLLWFRSFYKILEKLMLVLVSVMLISFLGTLLIIRPELSAILSGMIPRLPGGSFLLAVAMVASSFSIVGAFYQSYLVQEKQWRRRDLPEARAEGVTGIAVLGLIGIVILICAAAVLHPLDITIRSAADMGLAIEPLFGIFATTLFMIGLFGASFSSLVGNATVGGTLLGDAFGLESRLSHPSTRILISLVMLVGAAIAVWFGSVPLDLIVFAQGVTIFIVPFIGIILFLTANDRQLLGDLANRPWQRLLGIFGLLILFLLAGRNIYTLFF